MSRLTLMVALLLLLGSVAHAQTLSPPRSSFADCSKKACSGTIQFSNDGLKPMTFTLELAHVDVYQDGPKFTHLQEGESIDVSESSGRLGPKETREVDFKVRTSQPGHFTLSIMVVMRPPKADDGISVGLVLAHFVYGGCKRASSCRDEILSASGYKVPQ